MTREEIRQAFRQAQQEEFAHVPQQPAIHASLTFQRKMERRIRSAPWRLSGRKKIAVALLAAVVLALGGCTVYQAVTNGAVIKQFGPYDNLYTGLTEYHYNVLNGNEVSEEAPRYQLAVPEGFVSLWDNSLARKESTFFLQQWYNPDTLDVLTLTQQSVHAGLGLMLYYPLEPVQQNGITVFYGSSEQQNRSCAFWLYGNVSFVLEYSGQVDREQMLDWVAQMDYTPADPQPNPDPSSEFYVQIVDRNDSNQDRALYPIGKGFAYRLTPEIYELMEEEETGREENIDYNFASAPEGYTLIRTKDNTIIDSEEISGFSTNGAEYTYQNSQGRQIVLTQYIAVPLPKPGGFYYPPIDSTKPMEEVQVSGMAGLYVQEEDYAKLVWRYGGRLMEITCDGQMSQEEMIALAQTVDFQNGIPAVPAPEDSEAADADS